MAILRCDASLVPSPSHPCFCLTAMEKSEGEGLVPIITCRDVLTCKVDLHAHAAVLTCPHSGTYTPTQRYLHAHAAEHAHAAVLTCPRGGAHMPTQRYSHAHGTHMPMQRYLHAHAAVLTCPRGGAHMPTQRYSHAHGTHMPTQRYLHAHAVIEKRHSLSTQ